MNATAKTFLAALALATLATSAPAHTPSHDPTKYDCRVTTRVQRVFDGSRVPGVRFVKECPHIDKLAAGQCEINWLGQMRCKE